MTQSDGLGLEREARSKTEDQAWTIALSTAFMAVKASNENCQVQHYQCGPSFQEGRDPSTWRGTIMKTPAPAAADSSCRRPAYDTSCTRRPSSPVAAPSRARSARNDASLAETDSSTTPRRRGVTIHSSSELSPLRIHSRIRCRSAARCPCADLRTSRRPRLRPRCSRPCRHGGPSCPRSLRFCRRQTR